MELDNENNRTVFLRESDPFMPILPSPERQEEFLEEGLKKPPSTPIHSPHAFLKEDRWLFSPPPVLTPEIQIWTNRKPKLTVPPMILVRIKIPKCSGKEPLDLHL